MQLDASPLGLGGTATVLKVTTPLKHNRTTTSKALPYKMAQQQTSSSSWKPNGGHETPSLGAADASNASSAESGVGAPPALAVVSPDLAHFQRIRVTNAWHELRMIENKIATLSTDIVQTLLGLSLPRATLLVGELAKVDVCTIGSLLTTAETITTQDNGSFKATGKLSSIGAGFIQDVAALRDKVNKGAFRALTDHPAERCK